MLKKITLYALAIPAIMACAAITPANAGGYMNGPGMNGSSFNGAYLNGTGYNGTGWNGNGYNGAGMNGSAVNGTEATSTMVDESQSPAFNFNSVKILGITVGKQ